MDRACHDRECPMIVVENISELLLPSASGLAIVSDGAVAIDYEGRVAYAGPRAGAPAAVERFDAGGRVVSPGLVDPHAHLVFAGSRAAEFDLRNQGRSYQEIQAAGGGILSTVRATAAASDVELAHGVRARIDRLFAGGVTLAEAKNGYALEPEGELRLLRILASCDGHRGVELSRTFLFHVPKAPLHDMLDALARAAAEKLCEAVDIYCDAGASPNSPRRWARAPSSISRSSAPIRRPPSPAPGPSAICCRAPRSLYVCPGRTRAS
jgi:imidazolonepropionase